MGPVTSRMIDVAIGQRVSTYGNSVFLCFPYHTGFPEVGAFQTLVPSYRAQVFI